MLKKNHADEQFLARRNVRELPGTIERLTGRLSGLATDKETIAAHAGGPITIGGNALPNAEALVALSRHLDSFPQRVSAARRFPLGLYRGLRFGMILHPQFAPELYLEGATTCIDTLSRQHRGPRAVINALERLAGGYGPACDSVKRELTLAQAQLHDYQARVGTPFAHESYLSQLAELRDCLKKTLSGNSADADADKSVSATELAEQIKQLKAAHIIEAAPERTAKRPVAGEEPVTARIRRRAETASGPGPAAISDDSSPNSEATYQQLVAESRRQAHRQPA